MSEENNAGTAVVTKLVTTKSEAERAAELKVRIENAMNDHVLPLFDEANQMGLMAGWDSISVSAPSFKNRIIGLKLIKQY